MAAPFNILDGDQETIEEGLQLLTSAGPLAFFRAATSGLFR